MGDLKRSIAFYEALGFKRKAKNAQGVGFFAAGAVAFAVFPTDELAKDANISIPASRDFSAVALAWNCPSQDDVDVAYARALRAGARAVKTPQKAFWGGYQGYFADPDGHLWEIAHNPHFPLTADGRMQLPD